MTTLAAAGVLVTGALLLILIYTGLMQIVEHAHEQAAERDFGQRGGIVQGMAITIAIVLFALFAGCLVVAHHDGAGPRPLHLISYRDGRAHCDRDGDCGDDYGGHDSNRNRQRDRGAFSPGPFDRSPVQIDHNTVCVMPGSCAGDGKDKKSDDSGQPQRADTPISCLVPVPFHCDEHPRQLTDPRKLPAVVANVIKASTDLGKMFADGTITFVQTLLTTLA